MKSPTIWILGGFQTDFARNLFREGGEFSTLTAEVVDGTLGNAAISPDDIEVIHVGNAFGELYQAQAQLGAMPATANRRLWGIPASRHEAACASGGLATLAAMSDLRANNYDCALVLGIELEKNVSGDRGARFMGSAAWAGHEGTTAKYMWPHMFSEVAEEYDRRYGLDDVHLRAISQKNLSNAKRNPLAQTREWVVPDLTVVDRDGLENPVVEGRLRRFDCSQVTDGGAGLVLVNDRYLRAHPEALPIAKITGWGHRTAGLGLVEKFEHSASEAYTFPHLKSAIDDAFRRAGTELSEIDGVEAHDCFSISEYVAIDHIGLTPPGKAWRAIESGETELGGTLPFNPSGGLIGGGHPVGASGVRMVVDAAKQVSGNAGDTQIENAQKVATLNFGGSATTTIAFVIEQVAAR